jgi:hypothetical protein
MSDLQNALVQLRYISNPDEAMLLQGGEGLNAFTRIVGEHEVFVTSGQPESPRT